MREVARRRPTRSSPAHRRASPAAGAPAPLAETLLGQASTRGRVQGVAAALATLDTADAAIAAAAPRLAPEWLARLRALAACGRAAQLSRTGTAGAIALVDSGM